MKIFRTIRICYAPAVQFQPGCYVEMPDNAPEVQAWTEAKSANPVLTLPQNVVALGLNGEPITHADTEKNDG